MAKKKFGLGQGLDALFAVNDAEDNGHGPMVVRLSEIEPNKNQPRKEFDQAALEELADSIREHGVIQPLLVRQLETGGYQLVAGERRWRASRMAGLDKVPVVVREINDTEVMELGLIENLQREDLSPLEEANGYQELMNTYGLTQDEVARRVGKSRPAVANTLRILRLPAAVLPYLSSKQLSAGHARAILGLDDESEMETLAKEAARKGYSVREVERQVARRKKEGERSPGGGKQEHPDAYYREMELALTETLGRKVKIRVMDSGKGTLEVGFFDQKDLAELAAKIADE